MLPASLAAQAGRGHHGHGQVQPQHPRPAPGQAPVREEQDDERENKQQRRADAAPDEYGGLAQRQPAVVHPVVQHRVQAAVDHRDERCRQAEQEPALGVPGLAAGHEQPQQTGAHGEHHRGAVAGDLRVAGQVGQRHPGGQQRQPERAEEYSRHRRRRAQSVHRGLRCHRACPARWLRPSHGARYARIVPGTLPLSTGTPRLGHRFTSWA